MKKAITIFLILLIASVSFSQQVSIPDANFKSALINLGIDADHDNEISYDEASVVEELDVDYQAISDLTGIEAFVNLKNLSCTYNNLIVLSLSGNAKLEVLSCASNMLASLDITANSMLGALNCDANNLENIDVSANPLLTSLSCVGNLLDELNLSQNPLLDFLDCSYNMMDTIDMTYNPDLQYLYCSSQDSLLKLDVSNCTNLMLLNCADDKLLELDVSSNSKLIYLYAYLNHITEIDLTDKINLKELNLNYNLLTSLDLTTDTALDNINLRYMPTLGRVCVWELPFPPIGVSIDVYGSPGVYYMANCSPQGLIASEISNDFNVYPNPVVDYMVIEPSHYDADATVILYNTFGQEVLRSKIMNEKTLIDVKQIPVGVYFCSIITGEYTVNRMIQKMK